MRKFLALLILLAAGAWAVFAETKTSFNVGPVFSIGYADIYEYVYTHYGNTDTKLSELDWDVHDSLSLGGVMQLKSKYVGCNLQYKQLYSVSPRYMQDYDWLNAGDSSELTNYSKHENDVKVNRNFSLDITIPVYRNKFSLYALTGFQYLYTEMDSFNGWRTYKDEGWHKIDMFGKAISYVQKLELLWLGVTGDYQVNPNFNLALNLAGTPWIFSTCEDIHWGKYYYIYEHYLQDPTLKNKQFHWIDYPHYGFGFKADIIASATLSKKSMLVFSGGVISIPKVVGNDYTIKFGENEPKINAGTLGGTGYFGWDVSFSYRIRIF